MASPTMTGTSFTAFIPSYWDSVLGQNLYPNLFLYNFGAKRQVPSNFGTTIKIPRLKKQNIVAQLTDVPGTSEGRIVGTCGLSSQFVSGTLRQFAGAYKHSDIVIMTALSDVVELSLRDIARDIAKRMDTHVRDVLSAGGLFVGAAQTASGSVRTVTYPRASDILRATTRLDGTDNPRPPDGFYPFIMHPYQAFEFQNQLSSTNNNWLEINRGSTDQATAHLYRSEVGRVFGARILTSTNMKQKLGGAAALGLSAAASGYVGYLIAPEAYFVTEISEMTAKTFVKPLGSAGTADPVNQVATVGAKVFFTAIRADWGSETRYIRYASGGTLF